MSSSAQPPFVRDGTYLIKAGPDKGIGGEYITGGVPGTIFTIQAERPDVYQKFIIKFIPDRGAYTIEIDQNLPVNIGLAYEGPVAKEGDPVIVEVPRLFYIVPVSEPPIPDLYRIVVADNVEHELLVAVSPKRIFPPQLYLTTPNPENRDIWYLRPEIFE